MSIFVAICVLFDLPLSLYVLAFVTVTFDVREEAVGVSLADSTATQGVGESVGRAGEVIEDDYGIAVNPDHFKDISTGIDSSRLGSSGRFGFGVSRAGGPSGGRGLPETAGEKVTGVSCLCGVIMTVVL